MDAGSGWQVWASEAFSRFRCAQVVECVGITDGR